MGFLFRNWHLKLGAVALATILYTGLVFSGSFDERTIEVPVTRAGQPACCFLLNDDLGLVTVRFRVAVEAGDVTSDAFAATFDLSAYDLERTGEPQTVPVNVRSVADDVTVLGWSPREVTVVLDQVAEKEVPVEVDRGALPPGLRIDEPRVTADDETIESVVARGPSSALDEVVAALARVSIDPSGIDIQQPVDLEPVDINGQEVTSVDLEPRTVTVEIEVNQIETTRTVPVRPTMSGTAAAGYSLEAVTVSPETVTLRGTPADLAAVDEVATESVDIDGATEAREVEVALVLPDGIRLAEPGEGTVTVTAGIAATTATRTLALGVVCQGAGDNACLPRLEQVSATVSGRLAEIAALDAADVSAVVDATGLPPGEHTLPVSVSIPEGISLVVVSPGSVAVLIQAPATPAPTPGG